MLNLSSIDAAVLILFLLATVCIGWFAARHIKTREDYFMGSRRFGKILTAFSTFGAGTHSDQAVGVASKSYEVGLAGIWYQWVMLFTLPVYWLLAPVFRRARVLTTADFFEMRYGREFMVLYSIFGMLACVIFTAVMLFGSSQLIEALTAGGVPFWISVLAIGVVADIYGILGGLIGTVWNDFLQGIMTILMSIMVVPFFWSRIDGVGGFRHALPDPQTAFQLVMDRKITLYWIFAVSISSLLSMVVQPHIMSNTGSTKTEMDSRVGFTGGLLLKRLMSVPWALTGVMAVALYGAGTIKGDHAFGRVAHDLLPAGFSGLMIAGVLAAAMSTLSVLMISFSALWTNNIYRRFIRPASDERQLVFTSRVTSAVFGVGSISLAFSFGDMPSAMRFIWTTVPLMGIAFFLGLYWRRANRYGAFASFVGALAAMLLARRIFGWTGDEGLPRTVTLFILTGALCGIVGSYLTPPERDERLNRFYRNINTPVTRYEGVPSPALTEAVPVGEAPAAPAISATLAGAPRKLLPFRSWELPVPSREAWVGVVVWSGIVCLMVAGLNLAAAWLAGL